MNIPIKKLQTNKLYATISVITLLPHRLITDHTTTTPTFAVPNPCSRQYLVLCHANPSLSFGYLPRIYPSLLLSRSSTLVPDFSLPTFGVNLPQRESSTCYFERAVLVLSGTPNTRDRVATCSRLGVVSHEIFSKFFHGAELRHFPYGQRHQTRRKLG